VILVLKEGMLLMVRTCLAALFCVLGAVAAAAAPRPNVLFIAVDDLKPVLGCYGDPHAKTPNLDRLAARGMLFEKAYVNQAVCAPSRNTLMLGLRPQTLGIYDLPTHFRDVYPDAVTMSQTFMANGYTAEACGKIFHSGKGNHDDAKSWSVEHWEAKGGPYVNEQRVGKAKGAVTEAADVPDTAYGDGKLAEEAVRRIAEHAQSPDKPFLLMLGFHKPHLPFCAPKKYWDQFQPGDFKLPERRTPPEGAPEYAPTQSKEILQYRDVAEKPPFSEEFAIHLMHGYYAAVSYTDAQIGKVLDALDASGLSENTYIVLWGDHGWHLGDHGMWCKHTNYEHAVHIPLLISGPGITSGQRTTSLVETVDLYPTLMELTKQSLPTSVGGAALEGTSLVPVLHEPTRSVNDHVLSVYPRGKRLGRAVRTDRHRLVEWKAIGGPPEAAVVELYDYDSDPDETKNLAATQPEIVARLRAILAGYPEGKPQVVVAGAAATGAGGRKKTKTTAQGDEE